MCSEMVIDNDQDVDEDLRYNRLLSLVTISGLSRKGKLRKIALTGDHSAILSNRNQETKV